MHGFIKTESPYDLFSHDKHHSKRPHDVSEFFMISCIKKKQSKLISICLFFFFFQLIHFHYTPNHISGTKYIDPDSGLIYFKYDFGYEFGIIFPGEGRTFIAGGNKIKKNNSTQLPRNHFLHNSTDAIDIPVTHEISNKQNPSTRGNSSQFLQLHKKTASAGNQHLYKPQPRPAIAINIDEFHTNAATPSRPSVERGGMNNGYLI